MSKKFSNKDGAHRDAMLRNLLTSLFVHKRIKTTHKRARAIQPLVDTLINVVNSKNEMNAIRFAGKYVFTKESSIHLFDVAKKSKEQKSGFTRITPIALRDGDNAKVVQIELI